MPFHIFLGTFEMKKGVNKVVLKGAVYLFFENSKYNNIVLTNS